MLDDDKVIDPSDSGGTGGLAEVFDLFLKLGATSFGRPATSIALMEQEAAHKRR